MKLTKSCACYKIVFDCSISLKILTFSLKETMILGVIIMTRSWFKKKKKERKTKKRLSKEWMAEPMYTLCLQYFHNIFTTNFMWLVVIGGKKNDFNCRFKL